MKAKSYALELCPNITFHPKGVDLVFISPLQTFLATLGRPPYLRAVQLHNKHIVVITTKISTKRKTKIVW